MCVELKMTEYINAVYVPHNSKKYVLGVYDAGGKYIEYTGRRTYGSHDYSYSDKTMEEDVSEYIDDTAIWFGYLRSHYGHCLIDEVSRLWWLIDNNSYNGEKILCDITTEQLKSFYLNILSLLGVDERNIVFIKSITRVKKLLIPELSYIPGKYVTPYYFQTFQ